MAKGYGLILHDSGALALLLGDGQKQQIISTHMPLLERHWYLVAASVDTTSNEVWIGQRPLVRYAREDTTASAVPGSKSYRHPGLSSGWQPGVHRQSMVLTLDA